VTARLLSSFDANALRIFRKFERFPRSYGVSMHGTSLGSGESAAAVPPKRRWPGRHA